MALGLYETLTVSLLSGAFSGYISFKVQQKKLEKEFQLHDSAESVIKELLSYERFKLRSFRIIRHHLGGFDDDELRKILVRAGAIRFMSSDGVELWGLLDRNKDVLSTPRISESINHPSDVDDDLF